MKVVHIRPGLIPRAGEAKYCRPNRNRLINIISQKYAIHDANGSSERMSSDENIGRLFIFKAEPHGKVSEAMW